MSHPAAAQHLRPGQDIPAVVPTGLKRCVSETLPEVVERIVAQLDPEKIVLFGSYAYGAPTGASDVDLLVILDTDAPRRERTWLVSRLLIPRPFPKVILCRQLNKPKRMQFHWPALFLPPVCCPLWTSCG